MSTDTIVPSIPDLSDPAGFASEVPHEAFDAIRQMPGLYWQPAKAGTLNGGFWCITRHADIAEIERNPEVFSSRWGPFFPTLPAPHNEFSRNIMYNDPPDHSRLRRAAARSFGPRVIANFDTWVREIVVEVLEDITDRGEVNWIDDVAAIIPSRVIARVIGVPHHDRQRIVDWTLAIFDAAEKPNGGESMLMLLPEIHSYLEQLRTDKLRDPQDDFATVLARCVERGEISQPEFLAYLILLLIAGFETTHTVIAQAMRLILEDSQVADVTGRAIDGGSLDGLVDEFLRYVTPAMNMARTVTRDVDFHGTQMREGDLVQMFFTAANRDPVVFADPHRFDPFRTGNEHMSFGNGPHHCIGKNLARLELRILFEEMHRRGVLVALNGEPRRGWSTFINKLLSMPVTVTMADRQEARP
ncbi:cytochrome P450 [Streptomyces sp. NBC_01451]|uniref:cytochrome P450 n=1 Tax=Streptomyces sp. NBC_01451 TaxID=2903872 RepID=UPI002E338928|nr:cytochrome P450 [Streptomyces sp. NBC_01451]